MLCANCSDIDLFAILKGDHKGIPLEEGHEVWITRTSEPTAIWVWVSQPDCEFCEFLSATQIHLLPQNASKCPRYLQLDRGKSWIRKWQRDGPGTGNISSHINIVFDTLDGSPERWLRRFQYSDLHDIVSFSVRTDTEMSNSQPSPLRVDEISTWLDLSSIKRHLQNCLHHHDTCHQQEETSSSRPSQLRVIDCATRSIVTPSGDIAYVALSYRWGKSHTESQYRQTDMLPMNTPATIEDAIRVTGSLGFQYLWVDSYCILQADEHDFNHQIRQMHLIYRSAQITIIAGGDTDASSGLVGVSTPRANVQTKGRYDKLNLITFSLWPWSSVLHADEWAKRGWTFQEGFFSRLRLVFTDKQVLFDCDEGVISEDLQHSQIQYRYMLQKWNSNIEGEDVYNLVEGYTERALTYNADILNAFDGIMRDFEQREPPVRSHWGIPLLLDASGYLNGLLRGLCWRHPIQDGNIYRRPGFPSWSWAGWLRHLLAGYPLRRSLDTKLVIAEDLAVQVEKQDELIEAWKTFEEASPASTQRHHYSQRIRLSAPSLEIRLHKRSLSAAYLGQKIHGHDALVVRSEEDDYWSEEALLDSPFETLELSSDTYKSEEIRTCYAIYLFSADKMTDQYEQSPVHNVFAMLLVSKVGTNWERVGLWMQSFESEEEAQSFEQWLQGSSTYQTRGFWIA